jgi:hypothetical protein
LHRRRNALGLTKSARRRREAHEVDSGARDIYFLLRERLGDKLDYGTREGLSPALRAELEREAIRIF